MVAARPAATGKRHVVTLTVGWCTGGMVGKQPVMSVQQWETAPQMERVAGVRRNVVAYAAGQGVVGLALADLAIGVSAVLAGVVRSSRHVGSSASVSVSVDIDEDRVLARVRGPQAQTARLDNPGVTLGMVTAASLACDVRVCSPGSTGIELSMRFPRAAAPRGPMPAAASVPRGRLMSAGRESVQGAARRRTPSAAASPRGM
jgi:hypothetical protein